MGEFSFYIHFEIPCDTYCVSPITFIHNVTPRHMILEGLYMKANLKPARVMTTFLKHKAQVPRFLNNS